MRGFWNRLKLLVALRLLQRVSPKATASCANRYERRYRLGTMEVTVVIRDTDEEDGYSREELLDMQKLIWKHENRHGWRVDAAYTEQELRELRGHRAGCPGGHPPSDCQYPHPSAPVRA